MVTPSSDLALLADLGALGDMAQAVESSGWPRR
jgi:hypothetical protein